MPMNRKVRKKNKKELKERIFQFGPKKERSKVITSLNELQFEAVIHGKETIPETFSLPPPPHRPYSFGSDRSSVCSSSFTAFSLPRSLPSSP